MKSMPNKSKTATTLNEPAAVIDALRSASHVLITSHINPDGDAVGSMLALASLARALGVEDVTCALHDPVPRVYDWLPGSACIAPPEAVCGPYDVILLADANALERSGDVADRVGEGATVVIIDHHLTDEANGNIHFIEPTYAATGEMVVDLFENAKIPLTREVAECIYVALSTDTGNFRYANTTARSHRIAAKLLETGIDVRDITSRVIDTMSLGKFHLLRRLLDRAELCNGGQVAHAFILNSDLAETGALSEDVDGLINYLRNLEGVKLAVLFREEGDGETKVSFRSHPEINSAEIADRFGGGGHAMAAGATLPWPLDEARAALFAYLRDTLRMDL